MIIMDKIKTFLQQENSAKKTAIKAVDYAILQGVLMRTSTKPHSSEVVQHAPFTLFPSPVPEALFRQALEVQKDFNLLMHTISQDYEFMKSAFKSVIQTDEFTKKLFDIYDTTRKENPKKSELAMIRSDYMFNQAGQALPRLKQIEVNMIAASFHGIGTEKITSVHKHVLVHNGFKDLASHLPENHSLTNMVEGMIAAWKAYGKDKAVIAFIVAGAERNIFDQRCIEFRINEINPAIPIARYTFTQVVTSGVLDEHGRVRIGDDEIAVVYYRAGYTPKDYPSQKEWDARLMLDRSKAINCPSVGHQLVGAKKMQQVLAQPGVLERFVKDTAAVKRIRDTFAGFYGLEMGEQGDAEVTLVMKNPDDFVLKPQLEGGGNNLYNEDIVEKLKEVGKDKRRCSYIAMEKIRPMPVSTVILSAGAGSDQYKLVEGVSELGIYGILLSSDGNILQNTCAGHLLRTKASHHDDGGVAAGVAVLDSPLLI